ncbi:MAG: multidrug effflux MFS transporter [Micrococcaceae bacterium]
MAKSIVRQNQSISKMFSIMLLSLTAFGPISMDLYLPVLPALTHELGTSTSTAQLTLTACLLGLGAGQLVAGPLSDRFGRRNPLLIGLTLYVIASALCAISPNIEILIAARLVQGLAGAVGIVLAQATGRDIYEGNALVRYYARLTVLAGLAAIVAPLMGGQLALITDWHGIFWFLAGIGVVIFTGSLLVFRETLPLENRISGGFKHTIADFRILLTDRVFFGAALITGLLNAALFAYISGSSYILQDVYGLSPQGYSLVFGLNSFGYMLFGWIAGRTAARWERGTLLAGIIACVVGSLGLLTAGVFLLPLWLVISSLFIIVSSAAITTPPSTALALRNYPQFAGTASSVLGSLRFGFGAIVAPLVGIKGLSILFSLGMVTMTVSVLALILMLVLIGLKVKTKV